MSRSVDLLKSETAAITEDLVMEKDNNNDESIAEDVAVDNNLFDPHVDGMLALVPENKEENSIEENESSSINNDSAHENNKENSIKENESSIISDNSAPESNEEDSIKSSIISNN